LYFCLSQINFFFFTIDAKISQISLTAVHFIPNFVAKTTGFACRKIWFASFDDPFVKPPIDAKISQISFTETEL